MPSDEADNVDANAPALGKVPFLKRPGDGGGDMALQAGGGGGASLVVAQTASSIGDTTPAPSAPPQLAVQPQANDNQVAVKRVIIYSGAIQLVTANIASTIESIRQMSVSIGGYLQDMDSHSITVRIPADKFDDALNQVASKGRVTDKQIKAADVTEQMRDLGIRLANAQQTRQQLLDLLNKSTKVEDTIKIEAELERVTAEVELLKGKIRAMQLDVDYSVLHVEVNSSLPQARLVATIPFPWVRALGDGAVSGVQPQAAQHAGWFSSAIGFQLPPGYLRYFEHDDLTEAMSADGVIIKAQRHDNYKGGDIQFWGALAKRALVENNSVAIDREQDLHPGRAAHLIEGVKDIPGTTQKYLLLIAVDSDHVYTFEAWGPKPFMERDQDTLEKAAESMAK